MERPTSDCHVCGQAFEVRFRYQVREEAGGYVYVCSTACKGQLLAQGGGACACSVCGAAFALEFPYQAAVRDGVRAYFCTPECRTAGESLVAAPTRAGGPRRIAVFNHKGGTGKTTTSVNLAGYSVQYASSTGTSWQVTRLADADFNLAAIAASEHLICREA